MADTKITGLTANTAPISTDLLPMVDDPGGTPATQKVTFANAAAAMVPMAIVAAAAKATPVDADSIGIVDSEAANVLKETTWTQVKAFLKTYFDTLYPPIANAVPREFTRIYTASATWTKPASASFTGVRVWVVGGSGGGGGSSTVEGGAGGRGAYAYAYQAAAALGSTEAVVVGAAGAAGEGTNVGGEGEGGDGGGSSFNGVVAGPGLGGVYDGSIGAFGTASGGDWNIPGIALDAVAITPLVLPLSGGGDGGTGVAGPGAAGLAGAVVVTELYE